MPAATVRLPDRAGSNGTAHPHQLRAGRILRGRRALGGLNCRAHFKPDSCRDTDACRRTMAPKANELWSDFVRATAP